MKPKLIHGYQVEYLAIFRAGKSQYEGCFIYQVEALVDGIREVRMIGKINTIKEAKRQFEWQLYLRRERCNRVAA